MKDKELLELAAKAAGITYKYYSDPEGLIINDDQWPLVVWNPLTDDGDALRLAVKLHFAISWTVCFVQVAYTQEEYMEGEDAAPATRRAVVLAAATVGKETK
jgi:hypothetical protein